MFCPDNKKELAEAIDNYLNNKNEGIKKFGIMNDWDVSKIIDMSWLFSFKSDFNENISNWDVSNVKNMNYMFHGCTKFNQDISNWDVSNVKNMNYMFNFCLLFNQDISKWNVSNVESMKYMFGYCKNFTFNLNNWNISKVKNMKRMFYKCIKIDKTKIFWDTKHIDTTDMFKNNNNNEGLWNEKYNLSKNIEKKWSNKFIIEKLDNYDNFNLYYEYR